MCNDLKRNTRTVVTSLKLYSMAFELHFFKYWAIKCYHCSAKFNFNQSFPRRGTRRDCYVKVILCSHLIMNKRITDKLTNIYNESIKNEYNLSYISKNEDVRLIYVKGRFKVI